jgi:hypothetical protein
MWGWYLKNNEPLSPRKIYLDTKEITQDALAEELSRKLAGSKKMLFISAAGTGKTLVAIEAMVRLVADKLADGEFLLYLTPYKSLQKSVLAMYDKMQYKLADGKVLKPVALYGRSEFKCPYWLARGKDYTADKCVRQDCVLYLPPMRPKFQQDLIKVASWGSWFLYGVKKEEINYSVTKTEKTTLLDNAVVIGEAALCPYFAQYAELNEGNEDYRVLVLNYDKFLRDYMLKRITPSMIAGIIIDEADKFFARFTTPQVIAVEDLKLIRRAIKKQAEQSGDIHLQKAIEELETVINMLETDNIDKSTLIGSLTRFVRLLYESDNVSEDLINDVTSFLNVFPENFVEYEVTKSAFGEVLLAPKELKFFEEFTSTPVLGISATMDYVSFHALNLHRNFSIELGQQKSPGMVVLWLLKNAEPLVGWHIRRKVINQARFRSLVQEALEKEVLSFLDSLSLTSRRTINVGFAFATIYAQIMEQVGRDRVYADIVGRPLDRAISELASGKLVVSTRFMRGVNLLDMIDANTKTILAFIPKYPRAPPDSLDLRYYTSKLTSGTVFPAYMLARISNRNFLVDNWDISTEKSLADLYQAIGRGLRGEDYTVIIASTDIEVYGAVTALADAGFINRPLIAYDGLVYEPTEKEWRYLQDIYFNKYNSQLMKERYGALLDALLDRGETESKYRLIDVPALAR